jgi:hypothetical protein
MMGMVERVVMVNTVDTTDQHDRRGCSGAQTDAEVAFRLLGFPPESKTGHRGAL